jgi:YVTN family beta-propeller protein
MGQISAERELFDEQLQQLVSVVRDALGERVVGAYLHGSALLGGMRPRSDIDVLAVSSRSTTTVEKRRCRRKLLVAAGAIVLMLAVAATVLRFARSGGDVGLAGVASNSVGVIDPRTNRIAGQIPVGSSPTRIAVGENAIWVLNADDRTIVQIDPASQRPVRTFTAARAPTDVAVGFGSVWVAGSDLVEIVRVDPHSGAVSERLALSPLATSVSPVSPGVHLATGFGSVWVSAPIRPRDAFLARIDPDSTRVSAKLTRVYAGPVAVGADAVWMVKWGAVTHVDPSTNSRAQRSYEVALDGQIAADDRFVWIADELGESVWQLDAGNWRVMRSIQVGSLAQRCDDRLRLRLGRLRRRDRYPHRPHLGARRRRHPYRRCRARNRSGQRRRLGDRRLSQEARVCARAREGKGRRSGRWGEP